ncbi:MAG: NADH:ubiquinone oxidoreductase subunit J [Micavibrio sp.]|nr:NADH:ubiquinone oxidoreductase subunit J [Micavibrio sp.]HCK33438.1 NADH-quinone oxidoreductase subunit J [Rhodospirillaceae bacterium]
MIETLVFYLFAFILTASAVAVITARNPVHSVLFLILGFFTSAGLFVMLGAEFMAMILAIVYVGAVAVLFLFVVMMLDIGFEDLRKGAMQYVPLGLLIGGVVMFEFFVLFTQWDFSDQASIMIETAASTAVELTNTEAIGRVLYTDYVLPFQLAGLILFVAMVGAIVLTLRKRPGVHRQKIKEQVTRKREDAVAIKKVTTGTGI